MICTVISYIALDFFTCLMCEHVCSQFMHLSHLVETMIEAKNTRDSEIDAAEYESKSLKRLFEYVRRYNSLVDFVRDLDGVVNKIILAQILLAVILLSFSLNAILVVRKYCHSDYTVKSVPVPKF